MHPLALYCKSFDGDLKRVCRLATSIELHNKDDLPFDVSVPKDQIKLFRQHLPADNIHLIPDEDIIAANPAISVEAFKDLPGHISQQIVKSEFWRLQKSEAYLCLDSDSVFIRDFHIQDYMDAAGTPYTVMNEAQEFLSEALRLGKNHVLTDFERESKLVAQIFDRHGKHYSFGPMPMVWHSKVWGSLDNHFLKPRGVNFMDAILQAPLESRWYGEALLKYRAIPLIPCEPFFKVYHYAWQLDLDLKHGLSNDKLAQLFTGVIYQSAWERDMDWPQEQGGLGSKIARRVKRKLGKI